MKTKSKIIIFICAFALLFSLVSVSCFAFVPSIDSDSVYTFSPNFTFEDPYNGLPLEYDFSDQYIFNVFGNDYYGFSITDYQFIIYNDTYKLVCDSSGLWSQYDYSDNLISTTYDLSFSISYDPSFVSGIGYRWLIDNLVLVSEDNSFYSQIFNSISGAVFGEGELTPEQNLSLSLISTVVSIGMVLLPVLLAIGFLLRCFRL